MSENERFVTAEFNPYDHLIEPETEPVRSPVILGNASEPERKSKTEKNMEIIPLASAASYSKLSVRECETIDIIHMEVEEDLLVPDTFPDMETILNMDAAAEPAELYTEEGIAEIKGKINLETMYRSAENYGINISVVTAAVSFGREVKADGDVYLNTKIGKVEYRIINERKYKVKIHLEICVKCEAEKQHMIFEGIEGENLYLRKETATMADMISRKNRESEINEELLINDEKIRPVKILKSKVTVAENYHQLTKEKLILNQTLWVRVLYLAEIASKGNLSNQPMLFQGKIDHTEFITFGKSEGDVAACTTSTSVKNINVDINRESNGFVISGNLVTEAIFYGEIKSEIVSDFYHEKEEMTCDRRPEKVCESVMSVTAEQTLRERIRLQDDAGEDLRIIYMDAQAADPEVSVEGASVSVRGKLHLEAVIMNEGDYTVLAKKICDFSCVREMAGVSGAGKPELCSAGQPVCGTDATRAEHEWSKTMPQGSGIRVELDRISVREITGDIVGREINLTAQLQANLNIYNEAEINCISNPCIIRSGTPVKYYPITVHTVVDGESIWDIGKKYKVAEACIRAYNKPENIRSGNKIIIVK